MNENDLDLTPRYAPDKVIIANGIPGGRLLLVTRATFHPVGTSHGGPIHPEWGALCLVTEHGARWYGCKNAYINSELRMVVIGTPKRDEVRMKWEIVPENQH